MIKKFIRNENYFKNKLEKENKKIAADDFDSQFNNISEYLNDIIKPAMDSLVDVVLKGVEGNAGAFLHNIGDGTTDWQQINSDLIDDYSISFKKIAPIVTGSVLIAGADGNITEAAPTTDYQVLLSRNLDTPEWRKINTNDIANKTLTGRQFGVLAMENFTDNQFITNIVPNVIKTINIKDLAITSDKIADASITLKKIGIFTNLPVVINGLTDANIDDGAISSSKLKDFSIAVMTNSQERGYIWGNEYGVTTSHYGYKFKQLLKSINIADNSIGDSQLVTYSNYIPPATGADRTRAAQSYFKDVPLAFQFQSNHIALDSLGKVGNGTWFYEADVQAAINRIMALP